MRRTLFALLLLLLAGASAYGAQVSIGIAIGPPPPPRAFYAQPPLPGPGFFWVGGYWYPVGRRYKWHADYWTRPPYEGAVWIAPRYDGGHYFAGYWEGNRGRIAHDHRWDRYSDRDFHGRSRNAGRH